MHYYLFKNEIHLILCRTNILCNYFIEAYKDSSLRKCIFIIDLDNVDQVCFKFLFILSLKIWHLILCLNQDWPLPKRKHYLHTDEAGLLQDPGREQEDNQVMDESALQQLWLQQDIRQKEFQFERERRRKTLHGEWLADEFATKRGQNSFSYGGRKSEWN